MTNKEKDELLITLLKAEVTRLEATKREVEQKLNVYLGNLCELEEERIKEPALHNEYVTVPVPQQETSFQQKDSKSRPKVISSLEDVKEEFEHIGTKAKILSEEEHAQIRRAESVFWEARNKNLFTEGADNSFRYGETFLGYCSEDVILNLSNSCYEHILIALEQSLRSFSETDKVE